MCQTLYGRAQQADGNLSKLRVKRVSVKNEYASEFVD